MTSRKKWDTLAKRLSEPAPEIPPSTDQTLSLSDELVELKPPADSGFSGTALLHRVDQANLIADLLKRGYTDVTRASTVH